MPNYVKGVNPKVIRWARERAGYSLEDVAQSFKKDVKIISGWENGDLVPTYNQLERLAYVVYKRPLAIFFFPSAPDEEDIRNSFRSLPAAELDGLEPDTRLALRQAKVMQLSLSELLDGKNDSERMIFKDIRIPPGADPIKLSLEIRKYLGISLDEQFKWGGIDNALKKWRDVVEDNGIFVFKRTFEQSGISGFCLIDNEFPVIYLNNSTTKSRQIFSLMHELAHILLSTSGVTKENRDYIKSLKGDSRLIEIFCNKFAAELLVPSNDFENRIDLSQPVEKLVTALARKYSVSREVILRKLLDRKIIDPVTYAELVEAWEDDRKEAREKRKPGGDYYATQAAYLGQKYLSLLFTKYHGGDITLEQLADYARLKTANALGVEQFISFSGDK